MCDSPTKYMNNPESVQLISEIPTVWDETVALDGRLGEYAVIARRSGEKWYIGAITNWEEREIEIDFSKLGITATKCKAYIDGINANRNASDYKIVEKEIKDNKMVVKMKKGGGVVLLDFRL